MSAQPIDQDPRSAEDQQGRPGRAGRGRLGVPLLVVAAVAGLVLVGAVLRPFGSSGSPCDFAALATGCGTQPAKFEGADCAAVGAELGRQLDTRLRDVLSGPQTVDGNDRSVRAVMAGVYFADQANKYLRQAGLVNACTADELLRQAEALSSDAVRAGAPRLLARDGATFQDWLASLRRDLQVVDDNEDEPYLPSVAPSVG